MFEINLPHPCTCGRNHQLALPRIESAAGALLHLGEWLPQEERLIYLLADRNTWQAAGQTTTEILQASGRQVQSYVYPDENLVPDARALGQALLHAPAQYDRLVVVGSGTLNDIGKLLVQGAGKPLALVATAPSMDGFASSTSSMVRDGLKVSLTSAVADLIVGDLDVLARAPQRLIAAGLGDMLAKTVSVMEWEMAHLITGEYFCRPLADLVLETLQQTLAAVPGLKERKPAALEQLFQGLVFSGLAMTLAGLSRPASGVEHYFSHVWDMRAAALGTTHDLHGLQCGVATLLAIDVYKQLPGLRPDPQKAARSRQAFQPADWEAELVDLLGSAAPALIQAEALEQKYLPGTRLQNFQQIEKHWTAICRLVQETLLPRAQVQSALAAVGAPTTVAELTIDRPALRQTFRATKDIRDKYNVTRLLFDLGELDAVAQRLFPA